MATIVNTKFFEADLEATLTEWESEIHKMGRSLNSKVADDIKIGVLSAGSTGKIRDHSCLTLADTLTHEDMRATILHFLKSLNLAMSTKQKRVDWMDV